MKSRVVCLAPGHAVPGMVLAAPISGNDGHVLLAAGSELDAAMLDRLIRRGVETVFVNVLDTRDDETVLMELRAAELRVEHIFRGPSSPVRDALRAVVLEFRRQSVR